MHVNCAIIVQSVFVFVLPVFLCTLQFCYRRIYTMAWIIIVFCYCRRGEMLLLMLCWLHVDLSLLIAVFTHIVLQYVNKLKS